MNSDLQEKSALVAEFYEGVHVGGKVVDFDVINYIVHNIRGKYMAAALAWWQYKDHLFNFEWDLMQCEPQELENLGDAGVFLVHEGIRGNHELISQDEKTGAFLVYGDLECQEIIGTVQFL